MISYLLPLNWTAWNRATMATERIKSIQVYAYGAYDSGTRYKLVNPRNALVLTAIANAPLVLLFVSIVIPNCRTLNSTKRLES